MYRVIVYVSRLLKFDENSINTKVKWRVKEERDGNKDQTELSLCLHKSEFPTRK